MKKHNLNTAEIGDLWAITLGEDYYGYVRIFQGSCLGVIPVISKGILPDPSRLRAYPERWFFGFAAPPTDRSEVFRIGVMPFPTTEAAWPPPRYVPPDIFKGHFRIWERGVQRRAEERETKNLQRDQSLSPDGLRRFIQEHRDECSPLEAGAGAVPSSPREETSQKDQGTALLEVVFRNADFPFSSRDAVEDPLAEALEQAGAGEVTGGGGGPETCAIDVEVTDIAQGLKIIRQILKKLGCPASTEIHQHMPEHVVHRL